MPVPILAQGAILIASVQSALTDADLIGLRYGLLTGAGRDRYYTGVVVDVTGLDVLDSFAARTLQSLAATLKLRGVDTVIVGIQPAVAIAMTQLGLTLPHIATALDLDEGLAHLANLTAAGAGCGS